MKWFKFYSEFRSDPKIQRLPIHHRFAFVILLCLANEGETRGVINGLDDDDIAYELEMPTEDWLTLKAKFKAKGMIDINGDLIIICNWNKRQYDKPSDTPEESRKRKEAERQRKKAAKEAELKAQREEQLVKASECHANVTPMSRDVTPGHAMSRDRLDLERDLDLDQEDLSLSHNSLTAARGEKEREKSSTEELDISNLRPLNSHPSSVENFEKRFTDPLLPWQNSKKRNDFNEGFVGHIQRYLTGFDLYKTRKPEPADAKTWIAKRQYTEQGIDEILAQWEGYSKAAAGSVSQRADENPEFIEWWTLAKKAGIVKDYEVNDVNTIMVNMINGRRCFGSFAMKLNPVDVLRRDIELRGIA